jgi:chromosome partitioning protein
MPVFSFANQKGGVGKTTSAVNISAGIARRGFRTLLIDLDPQGHVAFSFGIDKRPGLYRLICLDEPLHSLTINVRDNLDILPGDKMTEKVKRQITLSDFRETILLDLLNKTDYDCVFIDMAPSMDVLHVNGLVASDWVIIPTRLDAMAVDGVKEILRTMGEVTQRGYPFWGYSILPTFFERTTRETLVQFREIISAFGSHVWPPVPKDTRIREAAAYGQTAWEYSPNSAGIQGYQNKNKMIGGYQQIIAKLLEVING